MSNLDQDCLRGIFHTELEKYFLRQNLREQMRNQNPALQLFNDIMKYVECRCNENEAVDTGIVEPCFACQKLGDLIAELDKERWIK